MHVGQTIDRAVERVPDRTARPNSMRWHSAARWPCVRREWERGTKFGPVEIEAAIRTLPGVAEVAVAGVPDEDLGERVGALIVGDGGPPSTTTTRWSTTAELS